MRNLNDAPEKKPSLSVWLMIILSAVVILGACYFAFGKRKPEPAAVVEERAAVSSATASPVNEPIPPSAKPH